MSDNETAAAAPAPETDDHVSAQWGVAVIPGENVSITINIPWPFVTQGATPVHLYDDTPTVDGCFTPDDAYDNRDIRISLDDWTDGGADNLDVTCDTVCGPDGEGHCTFTVDTNIPDSGLLYLNVHLDYGLKGPWVDANPCDDGPDRYDQGAEDQDFGGWDALVNNDTETGPLALPNCDTYGFSHTDGVDTFDDAVQNVNPLFDAQSQSLLLNDD